MATISLRHCLFVLCVCGTVITFALVRILFGAARARPTGKEVYIAVRWRRRVVDAGRWWFLRSVGLLLGGAVARRYCHHCCPVAAIILIASPLIMLMFRKGEVLFAEAELGLSVRDKSCIT